MGNPRFLREINSWASGMAWLWGWGAVALPRGASLHVTLHGAGVCRPLDVGADMWERYEFCPKI